MERHLPLNFQGSNCPTNLHLQVFASPVYVKDIYHKSDDMNKAYIVLYTCASSRAIHLNVVPRFIARRGVPNLLVSDNGSTFKSEELKKLLADHRIE